MLRLQFLIDHRYCTRHPSVYHIVFHISIGGLGLAAFGIVFAIEMRQDSAKIPYYERDLREKIAYDPQTQYAVIRSSICTGEKVAGFKNKKNGQFTEVLVIRTPADEECFRRIFELESIKTEY